MRTKLANLREFGSINTCTWKRRIDSDVCSSLEQTEMNESKLSRKKLVGSILSLSRPVTNRFAKNARKGAKE